MRLMAVVVLAVGLGIVSTACVLNGEMMGKSFTDTTDDALIPVWVREGIPPEDMSAPEGFIVTPRGAYRIVMEGRKLSLKHQWACFRDTRNYYIFDVFGRSVSAENARRYGVKIDGVTGEVVGSG